MKILTYFTHPSDYHLFKNALKVLDKKGHIIKVFGRHKGDLVDLLKADSFEFKIISSKLRKDSQLSAGLWLLKKDIIMFYHNLKFRPDILVGNCINITHMSKLFNKPSILIRDDDNISSLQKASILSLPFASIILTPKYTNMGKYSWKQIRYHGFKELAYLHPKVFRPTLEMVRKYINTNKQYTILRFVKLNAYHDAGKSGLTTEIAQRIIHLLEPYGNIYITSERKLEPQFEKYRIKINPEDMHHALYFADMYIGDSQTMAAEAAVLGTPSLRFNDFVGKLEYLEELEHKYGLTYGIKTSEPEKLYEKIKKILSIPNLKEVWQKRRKKMLSEKINVTDFMVWFIENYPKSKEVMQRNPDYQFKFR